MKVEKEVLFTSQASVVLMGCSSAAIVLMSSARMHRILRSKQKKKIYPYLSNNWDPCSPLSHVVWTSCSKALSFFAKDKFWKIHLNCISCYLFVFKDFKDVNSLHDNYYATKHTLHDNYYATKTHQLMNCQHYWLVWTIQLFFLPNFSHPLWWYANSNGHIYVAELGSRRGALLYQGCRGILLGSASYPHHWLSPTDE